MIARMFATLIALGLLAGCLRSEATDPQPRAQTPEPVAVASVLAEARALRAPST